MVVVILWELLGTTDFVGDDMGLCISQVLLGLPSVFHHGISFPLDQEGVVTWFSSMSKDHFHFIFFFSIYKIWWWLEKVGTVFHSLLIGG